MSPRLTDWSLALTVLLAFLSGLLSLVSGHEQEWGVFALHACAGLWLLLLLWGKLRRVWPRVIAVRRWDRRTPYGLLALLMAAGVLSSGIAWMLGSSWDFAGFNLLNWHILLGFLVTLAVVAHLCARVKPLRKRDVLGRRKALHFGALLLGSVGLWQLQQNGQRILTLPGASERFTGSRESMSYQGNSFPTSSWVADQPRPLATQTWQLTLSGAFTGPGEFSYEELVAASEELEATLDCTGGFYSTQRWQGIRVATLLTKGTVHADARFVSFVSVTGYRWSLPLAEARQALLATHVNDEPLSHEHGFPLRLVSPGRRGFAWVKWITHVELLTEPDPGEVVSIFSSSFTDAGRGK